VLGRDTVCFVEAAGTGGLVLRVGFDRVAGALGLRWAGVGPARFPWGFFFAPDGCLAFFLPGFMIRMLCSHGCLPVLFWRAGQYSQANLLSNGNVLQKCISNLPTAARRIIGKEADRTKEAAL
jgi:hypothetical protein